MLSISAQAEIIRVRLDKNLNQYILKAQTSRVSLCKLANKCQSKEVLGNIRLSTTDKGIRFHGEDFQILFVSASSFIGIKGERLPKSLSFIYKKNKKMDLIANVGIEEYLAGVLPSEMPASWPFESLKAQAIASRSYVLYQKKGNKRLHFDVESDVMDQVFTTKRLPKKYQAKIKRVIAETDSVIISRSNQTVKAFFHSHCGGHTEMAANVWPGSLGFNTVADPYCQKKLPLNWKLKKSYKALEALYKKDSGDYEVSGLYSIQKGERNLSGRLENLFLFFKGGEIRRWNTLNFRSSIGFSKIKSTRFEIQRRDKEIVLIGSGYGHGVGLCQHGAKAMASLGKSYKEILNHYYPNTKLKHLTDVPKNAGIAKSH